MQYGRRYPPEYTRNHHGFLPTMLHSLQTLKTPSRLAGAKTRSLRSTPTHITPDRPCSLQMRTISNPRSCATQGYKSIAMAPCISTQASLTAPHAFPAADRNYCPRAHIQRSMLCTCAHCNPCSGREKAQSTLLLLLRY